MGAIASQITSLAIVYWTVYLGADQRKHQSSASLDFVMGIHREFSAQMASNAENVSIWWRGHKLGHHWVMVRRQTFVWTNIRFLTINHVNEFQCISNQNTQCVDLK